VTGYEPDSPSGGSASERTDLAWNRSGLALLACGATVLAGFPPAGLSARHAVGVVILLLGGLTSAFGAFQTRRRSRPTARAVATARDLLPVAVGTAGVGAAAFLIAAVYPG
jgi:putative membrane protein